MDDEKKMAAAIAAVNRYMEMEASGDDHSAFQDRYGGLKSRLNVWGFSGRQAQMQVRTLMQLRTFNT
jgi:hypothetical protein